MTKLYLNCINDPVGTSQRAKLASVRKIIGCCCNNRTENINSMYGCISEYLRLNLAEILLLSEI
jgi:hypothetical protein